MSISIIPHNTKIDFLGLRHICYILSLLVLAVGIASLVYKGGLHYGIDFAGGTVVQVKFSAPVEDGEVKDALATTDLPGISGQIFGNAEDAQYLIRISSIDEGASAFRTAILDALNKKFPGQEIKIERVESVGPKVGADLRASAIGALFYAFLLISIYVSGRFEQRWLVAGVMAATLIGSLYLMNTFLSISQTWLILFALLLTLVLCWKFKLVYALSALIGLVHDVLITVGLLSILNVEIDLIVIAGLLTVVGYSLNDTIIVFDRIRENLHKANRPGLAMIINNSVNQTLSRTILTSATTLMVLFALFFLGGAILQDFALTMIIGVITGTYSSIFISSPILLAFGEPPAPQDEDESKRIKEMLQKSHDGAIV